MMPDHLLYKLIYVLFSAFTEFLPVSPRAHQKLFALLTGVEMADPMVDLAVRLGVLIALAVSCKKRIMHLVRANRLARYARRHRNTHVDTLAIMDTRVLKTAVIPILLGLLCYRKAESVVNGTASLALSLTVYGILLFIPRIMLIGNKESGNMSRLDSVLVGVGGALGVIPGFSRIGGIFSLGQMRGVERGYALEMALLLSVPALLGLLILDFCTVALAKLTVTAIGWLCYLLMSVVAFFVGYLAITFLRLLSAKTGFSRFCYYNWGMAMFAFVLYLMI